MDPEPVFPFTQTFEGSRRVASLTNTLAPQPWTARWYLVSFTNPLASEMLLCFISLDISPPTEGRDSTVSLSGCCITCPRKEKRLLSLNNIVCAHLRTPATWAKTSVYPSADGGAAPLNPGQQTGCLAMQECPAFKWLHLPIGVRHLEYQLWLNLFSKFISSGEKYRSNPKKWESLVRWYYY